MFCSAVKISNMQVAESDGSVWIETSGAETNLNCTASSNVFLKLDANTSGGRNIYSALLAYKLADKALGFRVAENSNPCKVLYIVAD